MAIRPFACAVVLVLLCSAHADEVKKPVWKKPPPPKMPAGTPAEQVKSLTQEFERTWEEFAKHGMACTNKLQEMVLMMQAPPREEYAALLFKVATDHPTDVAAADALIWVVRIEGRNVRNGDQASPSAQAVDILKRDHLNHPNIGLLCLEFEVDDMKADSQEICRHVLEHNPNADARAMAAYSLSSQYRRDAMWAEYLAAPADIVPQRDEWIKAMGSAKIEAYRRGTRDKFERDANELLEKIVNTPELATVKVPRKKEPVTYGEVAKQTLFRERHLVHGKPAPEFEGRDFDDKPIKLSDHRGKVVAIVFWGTWCGPCMAQVPDEKKLVKKFAGRPFVLIGVNCDDDRDHAKTVAQRHEMNWPCIWDKGHGEGPLQRLFAVEGYPTCYVIDHEGKVLMGKTRIQKSTASWLEKHIKDAEAAAEKGKEAATKAVTTP